MTRGLRARSIVQIEVGANAEMWGSGWNYTSISGTTMPIYVTILDRNANLIGETERPPRFARFVLTWIFLRFKTGVKSKSIPAFYGWDSTI